MRPAESCPLKADRRRLIGDGGVWYTGFICNGRGERSGVGRVRFVVMTEQGRPVDEPYLLRLCGWTEERYFAEAPEDRLWEFKDGEVIVPSPATPRHQDVVGFLYKLLSTYVEERGLGRVLTGPATLRLREGLDKEPDVFFVSREREEAIGPTRVEGAAELVIEVASAGTRAYDVGEKAEDYREHGVGEYWVVDPERREVRVARFARGEATPRVWEHGRVESTAVPGFWVQAEWLWESPLPSTLGCIRVLLATSV